MSSTTGSLTWSGISVSAGSSPEPYKAPASLFATRAVEMKDGWTGQVIVCGEVLLEDTGYEKAQDAEEWATGKVVEAVKSLFQPAAKKR